MRSPWLPPRCQEQKDPTHHWHIVGHVVWHVVVLTRFVATVHSLHVVVSLLWQVALEDVVAERVARCPASREDQQEGCRFEAKFHELGRHERALHFPLLLLHHPFYHLRRCCRLLCPPCHSHTYLPFVQQSDLPFVQHPLILVVWVHLCCCRLRGPSCHPRHSSSSPSWVHFEPARPSLLPSNQQCSHF